MTAPAGTRIDDFVTRLAGTVGWLTTPLLPDDYLGLINPLWSLRRPRGRVEAVRRETRDAVSLIIRPGRGWTSHRAGQFVKVGVDVDGVRHWRTYSLSTAPERGDGLFTITVKAVPGGVVSTHLVHRTRPGTFVGLGRPEGDFVLPRPVPPRLLFVTAGSGITPVMAMLRSLVRHGAIPDVVLVHSAPTREEVIFGEELRTLARQFPDLHLHEQHTRSDGRLSLSRLPDLCPDWTRRVAWVCGPAEMLEEAETRWREAGIADRLHTERFRPVVAVTADAASGRVRFLPSGQEADADGMTPLLIVGERAGVLMPSGCRMGICYGCTARLRSGRVRDLRTGREHGEQGDIVQTCVSAAAGHVEIEALR
ncbi:ferredoxin reductase [Planotetraspora mira]|uniref:Oxidoreductase n=1 Tax=Planotetraspora mira TaxID=58121 RepID=A0A8J3TXT6_9ACTN|nr:ferredoxin reductase [Planotetraspora mira]GII34509.1 oxidoreductase [Planotetraspora mira]